MTKKELKGYKHFILEAYVSCPKTLHGNIRNRKLRIICSSHGGPFVDGVLTARPADALLTILPGMLILLGLIGTPIYLYNQRLEGQPWKLHAIISTVAFALWAYALGGSFFIVNQWYHPLLAAIAVPIFTFVAGMFSPNPTKPGPVGVR